MIKDIKLDGIVTKYTNKNKNFSFKKNNFNISVKPNITFNELNNEEIVYNFHQKFYEYIDNFITFIKKENPKINLDLFFENLKTLSIKERYNFNKFLFFKTKTGGRYSPGKNTIFLLKNHSLSSIYHELLHCASMKIVNGINMVGFRQYSYEKDIQDIGRGLNEGYTSLLTERYFKTRCGYIIEKYIASLLEKIVGKDKMENLFFTADLDNLIEELKKYSNQDEIITFIKYLDEIRCDTMRTKPLEDAKNKFNFISKFLLLCYSKKMYRSYKENLISFISFKKEIIDFENSLYMYFTKNGKEYIFLSHNDAQETLKSFCNDVLESTGKKK